jgi:hypothetical protein
MPCLQDQEVTPRSQEVTHLPWDETWGAQQKLRHDEADRLGGKHV